MVESPEARQSIEKPVALVTPPSAAAESSTKADDELSASVPPESKFTQFHCGLCGFDVRAQYGDFKVGRMKAVQPVYYNRNPFIPYKRASKPTISDYIIYGAKCGMCRRDVCVKVQCSWFRGDHYCVECVVANRDKFPEKVVKHIIAKKNK